MASADLEAVAAFPDRQAVLDRDVEADLLEGVGAEVDDLVAQGGQVAHAELARLVDEGGGLVAASVLGRVVGGRQDHVEADQLLDRAVVDRLGDPAAHLALRLHRAAREAARPQAGRRLGGPEQADNHRRRQRGQDEHRLVEGHQVAVERRVASQGRSQHQDGRPDRRDGQAAPLALEVRVGGNQEEGGEANRADGVGGGELEGEEQGKVAGRDHRADDSVGLAAGDHEHRDRPGHEDAQHQGRRLLVREIDHRHRRECHDRHGQAGDREHDDRGRGLDRDPAHQAAALSRTRSVRSFRAAAAAPAESIAQSTTVPWRPSTKVWWYSSVTA